MKLLLGVAASFLFILALGLYFHGEEERYFAYIETVENTATEQRGSVSEAYRQSWGIDKWSIAAGICAVGAVASTIAAIKLPPKKSSKMTLGI